VFKKNQQVASPFDDPTPPQITSVQANGKKLTISYDKSVSQSGTGGYEIVGNAVAGIEGSGTQWTLTLRDNWTDGQRFTYRMQQGNAAGNGLKVTSYIAHLITQKNSDKGQGERIEAEHYHNMNGVQTEKTSDAGGGLNVGWLDPGDWMNYAVSVDAAGTYLMNFRVAASGYGGKLEVKSEKGAVLGTLDVPVTGGSQKWQTLSVPVALPAGSLSLQLYVRSGGWNLNWFEVADLAQKTQAEEVSVTAEAFLHSTDQSGVIWSVYPNPAQDKVQVQLGGQLTGDVAVDLLDASGKVIKSIRLNKTTSESLQTLPLNDLANGLYFIRLKANGLNEVKKIMKQ
jgi:endoglucanase